MSISKEEFKKLIDKMTQKQLQVQWKVFKENLEPQSPWHLKRVRELEGRLQRALRPKNSKEYFEANRASTEFSL